MSEYKYYLLDNGAGKPYEIYRGDPENHAEFGTGDFWRARKDGTWSNEDAQTRIVFDLWLKGDFDPETDEITEAQAMAYLDQWRQSGIWPGRE